MSVQIVCGHCGGRNELGHVFCVHCGQRMDLSHASLQQLRHQKVVSGVRHAITRILLVGTLVAVVVVVALGLWPAQWPDAPRSERDRQRFRIKVEAVRAEIRARGAAQMTATVEEINAFLHGQRDRMGFDRIQVELGDGVLTLRAVKIYRPLAFVKAVDDWPWRVTCELRTGRQESRWVVRGGKIGHLPLPGFLGWLVTPFFRHVPAAVLGDPQLADALREITVTPDRMVLALRK